jgi:hypothetical protein
MAPGPGRDSRPGGFFEENGKMKRSIWLAVAAIAVLFVVAVGVVYLATEPGRFDWASWGTAPDGQLATPVPPAGNVPTAEAPPPEPPKPSPGAHVPPGMEKPPVVVTSADPDDRAQALEDARTSRRVRQMDALNQRMAQKAARAGR